ncbi:RagB/SusD family nutrient uptake outer membrane protein [Flavivirga sp. 57AJ16]|uniref:RagB/SusD family nutrient uptake outer membrane protein n=1 Tax=Flavivirga sp. 57AJ16 TaxID=3025307 RepID=UPI002366D08E|nr:RagB/SusD family nutrient uptake outer membrane protein [Flavivirga sp. 57AJ16]MDD7888021.1 RagB/SusD family nutrient uptake outer membrane protein [Flavivirga sp. 57AJ16]
MNAIITIYKSITFNKHAMLLICSGLLLFSSCEEWLDVSPSSEIKEEDLFSNEQGYKDALYGVYQKISENTLYGENLTLGFLDVLAQQYDIRAGGHIFFEAGLYQYDDIDVETRIDAIWSNMYTSIAQINFILKDIDANKGVFGSEVTYSVVKGEALALRALLHFDLVRMFGQSPVTSDGTPAIPYMEAFTVDNGDRLNVSGILTTCEIDLLASETLLSEYQEMDEIRNPAGELGGIDNFLAFRQNRMNYWAAKALLARLYLYMDNKESALGYAVEVIESGHFRFMTQAELNETGEFNDRTFSYEHVFSINAVDLRSTSDNYFRISANTNAELSGKLIVAEDKVDNIFEVSSGYSSDPRYNKLWQYSQSVLMHAKFWQDDNMSNLITNLIPVLRLSEMYYIAAESEPNTETAVAYLNEVRKARLIPELPTDIDASVLEDEIFKEYRKEFMSEGQLFYYYKRKNAQNIIDSQVNPITNKEYVFPLPLREIEFGNN